MTTEVFVGIDVSKDKIDVSCRGAADIAAVWARTKPALEQLAQELLGLGRCRVVLEASGGYERDVLDTLFAAGLEVFMVQPARARHFARSLGRYAKTDAIDASVLAHMAEVAVACDEPWRPRQDDVERLRALVHRRDHLVAHIDAETKRLRAANLAVVRRSIERVLALLHEERSELEERIQKLGERSEALAPMFDALTSVAGVGVLTAAVLIAEVPEIGTLPRNKIAALVGVAPMTRESGKWSGHRFITGGRTRARRALYMAALAAIRWNAHLREFYARLVARGKRKKVALVAVMRKLIIHLNSIAGAVTDTPLTGDHPS
jgi:transposase